MASTEETLALEPLDEKFRSFGWLCSTVDGHDHESLSAILTSENDSGKPHAVICKTVKGRGVSFMEDNIQWHYRPPNATELAAALAEIEQA